MQRQASALSPMNAAETKRRWFRFSLRSLLIFVMVAGTGLAFFQQWDNRAKRQRDAVAKLSSNIANTIWYENNVDPENDPPPVPRWLRGLLGFDHFYNVDYVGLSEATDDELRLLANFPNLSRLCLYSTPERTGIGLGHLQSLERLKDLTLFDVPALNDRSIEAVGSIRGLQHLQFQCGNNVTDAGLTNLARLSNLKSLSLKCGLRISNLGLAQIGHLSKLEYFDLDLDDATNATIDFFDPPALCVAYDKPIRGRSLECLRNLKQLESLKITGNAALGDACLTGLCELPNLKLIAFKAGDGVTDSAIEQLGRVSRLETLTLDCGHGSETDAGLAKLLGLSSLSKLELRLGPAVSDTGLASLTDCRSLQRLKLHLNDRVTGEGIAKFKRLKYLELDWKTRDEKAPPCRLHVPETVEDLLIHGSRGFADEDLAGLVGLTKLRQLDLFSCQMITDEGLEHLNRLGQLKELGIHWCDLTTDGGITKLRTSLPNCKIKVSAGGGGFGFWNRF